MLYHDDDRDVYLFCKKKKDSGGEYETGVTRFRLQFLSRASVLLPYNGIFFPVREGRLSPNSCFDTCASAENEVFARLHENNW